MLADTYDPDQHTVVDVLQDLVKHTPNASFLSASPHASLSYLETHRLCASLLPQRLIDKCPALASKANAKVIIISPNGPLVPLALWALWNLSVAAVPLSASVDPSLWVSMIEIVDADLILVAENLMPKLIAHLDKTRTSAPTIPLESLIPDLMSLPAQTSEKTILLCLHWLGRSPDARAPYVDPSSRPTPSTPAILMFTSSAIDAKSLKSVTYAHGSLLAASWKSIQGLGGIEYIRKPKRHLGWLPLSHCYELTFSYLGIVLRTGGTYVFHDPRVSHPEVSSAIPLPQLLLSSLEYHQPVDSFCVVPAILSGVYNNLTASQLRCLRSLSSLCAGGAASSPELAEWALRNDIKYADMMGATEMVGLLCTRPFWIKPDGFALSYGYMGVLEKENEEDTFGELIVMGKHLPSRYDFIDSDVFGYDPVTGVTTYRTQDLYSYGPTFSGKTILYGQALPAFDEKTRMSGIVYVGRLDDMVTFNSGIKVDALNLERTLEALPEISRCAIILNPTQDGLTVLIDPSPAATLPAVIDSVTRVNKGLPYEKRIQRENIIFVDSLPVTTKMTLHRKKLKRILANAGGQWPANRRRLINTSVPVAPPVVTRPSNNVSPAKVDNDVRRRMEQIIADIFSVGLDEVQDPGFTMSDLPITSLASVRLANRIQSDFNCSLTQAQLYSSRDISDLCSLVVESTITTPPSKPILTPPPPVIAPLVSTSKVDHLVISGVSCRYPGGIMSLDDLWSVLVSPQSHASTIGRQAPPSRWDADALQAKLPMAWLDDQVIDNVSSVASFFRLPPAEVEAMPPNIRLVMQMGYSALEDAGVAPSSLGGKPWGVFTSMNDSGWRENRIGRLGIHEYSRFMTSLVDDGAGSRLSYYLDLTGPAMEVKTACSSSLVAIHQACSSIRNGDCEAAIIVASTTHFSPAGSLFRQNAGIGSPSGRCATFSTGADGFLPSEGAVAIVIQRESEAQCQPYGRIRGSAVGQDGRAQNFTSPNLKAQARVIEAALKNAGCAADDIAYLEAHGTGTPVGDSIEIAAINKVFGGKRSQPLFVGAAKAVLGHTEECAGLTGILKSIQCFEHNVLPPQPHLHSVNPELDLYPSKIIFPRSVQTFSQRPGSRLIGISSFGLSGTLAHVILEECVKPMPVVQPDQPGLFLLSAISPNDLKRSMKRFLEYSETVKCQQTALADACRTSQIGRDHLAYRKAWALSSWKELVRQITSTLNSEFKAIRTSRNPGVSLWFSLPHAGQPAANATIDHPVYHDVMTQCHANGCTPKFDSFAKQLAVAFTLESLGCKISAVGGEGVGEYVAACFAGILGISTLFSLLASLAPDVETSSWVVQRPKHEIEERLLGFGPEELRIMGDYGRDVCCVSGTVGAINRLRDEIGFDAFVEAHPLTSCSCQSLPVFAMNLPRMYVVSSYLGEVMDPATLGSSNYWRSVPDRSTCVHDAVIALSDKSNVVVDVNICGGSISMPLTHSDSKVGDVLTFEKGAATVFGRLFELGCTLDWKSLVSAGPTVRLPTYPWSLGPDDASS